MNEWFILVLDVLIIALLVAVVVYAALLNRRLGTIKQSKGELEKLSQQFMQATTQAEASVQNLKVMADGAGRDLEQKITKAQALQDELAYLVQRADDLAEKLTEGISANRPKAKAESGDLGQALKELEKKAEQWEQEGQKPSKAGAEKKAAGQTLKSSHKGLR